MIEYISGEVVELTPTSAVIETTGGVGYFLNITLYTYTGMKQGERTRLWVHEAIREDAYVLYGFRGRKERELFQLLISVSGVGPNTARMILSGLSPEEFEQVIATENVGLLKSVKGIGAKTAQRIIVDLKDKIKAVGSPLVNSMPQVSETYEEAMAALSMLGFAPQASQKVVQKLMKDAPGIRVEEVIKQALKML
ncbi:MAG: Holliday junction branch migration protein RuvA [Bacteroidaceae bacterium]|nr:Holliday junction branch migration protein RuvA [Bacteroidaceae bacterium]